MTVSAQVDSVSMIFEGRPVSTSSDDFLGKWNNTITTFTVSKMYRGGEKTNVDIIYKTAPGPSCGMRFSDDQDYLILAHKTTDGLYATNPCSKGYGFSDGQIIDYLENDIESYHLNSKCSFDFTMARINQIFKRKFELENPECSVVRQLYEEKYPLSSESDIMDGKPVHTLARYWADHKLKHRCQRRENRSLDYLQNIPTYLLEGLEVDVETADAAAFAIAAKKIERDFQSSMGTDTRHRLAGHLHLRAAKLGNAKSMARIGSSFLSCNYGLMFSTNEAEKWFAASARLGSASAQIGLAQMYLAGLIDAVDSEKVALDLLEPCKDRRRGSCRKQYDWLKSAIDNR